MANFSPLKNSVSLSGVIDASIGRSSGAAVDRNGKVWTWGYNELGQLGQIDIDPRWIPTLVKPIKKKKVYSIAVGSAHVIAIGENKINGSKSSKEEKRTKSIEPWMKSTNDGIETHKGIEFKNQSLVTKENPSKSVERIQNQNLNIFDFSNDLNKSDNKDHFEVNISRFTLGANQDSKEKWEETKVNGADKKLNSKSEDLVDTISEAAKKLMNDPNSYYFNLKKEDKSKPSTPVSKHANEKQISSELSTPDIGVSKSNKSTLLNGNSAPIEPFTRSKIPENSKDSKQQTADTSKSSGKEQKSTERVSITEVLKSRPKKVAIKEEPKVPLPKYEPLKWLEWTNIKSICESLGISKIDDVVDLINSKKHGKKSQLTL